MLVDILLGGFNIILKINRGCFSWLCFNWRVLGSRTLIVDFIPRGESTCHGRDQSTDQQASPFSSHSKGGSTEKLPLSCYDVEQKKEKYIRKQEDGKYTIFWNIFFPILLPTVECVVKRSQILLLLIMWQGLRFRKKALIILWKSLAVFLRNNHLKSCWCREINKRAIPEWRGYSVHSEQTGVEGKPIFSWKLHRPSSTPLSVLGWKREPLSMPRPVFSQHFPQWGI